MTWDHDRVEELLALHVVGGLEGEDAALAERALLEHVPECERCRRSLEAFRLAGGDLALAADPVRPPDAVRVRLRRAISAPPRASRWPAWAAGGAAAALVLALSAWSVTVGGRLSGRLTETERRQGWLVDALATASHPERQVVLLRGGGGDWASVLYVPGEERAYVVATDLPRPRFGYQVWFMGGGRTWHAGPLQHRDGVAMMNARTDPRRWDVVMITDEQPKDPPAPQASPLVSATVPAE